jgi:cytochrome c-type biogenesis protein CcsB
MRINERDFKVIRKFFFSIKTMFVLVLGLIVSIIIATLLERTYGSSTAKVLVYEAFWFEILWIWFSITLFVNLFHSKLWQRGKWDMVLFPFAFFIILSGVILTQHFAIEGYLSIREGETSNQFIGAKPFKLPFSLHLSDFKIERYKNSDAPSQFRSDVVIKDPEHNIDKPYSIYMNHILRYRGYRFYQYSFDEDEKGSVFFVSRDPGIPVAYAGFFLLIGVIVCAFFHPKGRIRELETEIRKGEGNSFSIILICLMVLICLVSLIFHLKIEELFSRFRILQWLGKGFVFLNFVFLLMSLIRFVSRKRFEKLFPVFNKIFHWAVWIGFLLFTIVVVIRWVFIDQAVWNMKYECMVFAGWASLLAGIALSRNSRLPMICASLLSGIVLIVSHMPSIYLAGSPLPPVLKSKWFILHVSTAMTSYGFFSIGITLAFLNLIALSLYNFRKGNSLISKVPTWSKITEQALWIGLLLLTIGSILGAIWANETWGQYWGWDPKESWTLIVILSYALVLNLRFVFRFHWRYWFNVLMLPAFGTLLMTYLGVNILFSGMHSYGGGSGFPLVVLWIIGVWIILSVLAYRNRKRFEINYS